MTYVKYIRRAKRNRNRVPRSTQCGHFGSPLMAQWLPPTHTWDLTSERTLNECTGDHPTPLRKHGTFVPRWTRYTLTYRCNRIHYFLLVSMYIYKNIFKHSTQALELRPVIHEYRKGGVLSVVKHETKCTAWTLGSIAVPG